MDLGSINMVFGETCKKLYLVPRLNLPKLPVSHTPAKISAYTVRFLNKEQSQNRFSHLAKHNPSFPVRILNKK